jgi:hypothetical protein
VRIEVEALGDRLRALQAETDATKLEARQLQRVVVLHGCISRYGAFRPSSSYRERFVAHFFCVPRALVF